MKKLPVRILIVEDDEALIPFLEREYSNAFGRHGYNASFTLARTVEEARKAAKDAQRDPFDLVSLDVYLGDQSLTGLDVLDTLKRFNSAWMIALLTGVEIDPTLDANMGMERGDKLRKQLRRDAYTRFPAERLLIVEKPPNTVEQSESRNLLSNRLEQIALVYSEINRLRYIFRPIDVISLERVPRKKGAKGKSTFLETKSIHWQIRFNCGEIRTLPNMAGFKTLHYLLTRNRNDSVTPEEALAIEPKTERKKTIRHSSGDPVSAYFEEQGILFNDLSETEQEKLIRAALSLKFNRYRELRTFQDDEDISVNEEGELDKIVDELGPLADTAELAYQRLKSSGSNESSSQTIGSISQDGLHISTGNYDRIGSDRRGKDSSSANLFRARMMRAKDCLRENGFADMAEHLTDYLMSTGANWSYNPPDGIEWTT